MRREDSLIVSRRFRSRAFESGLLVLAVALGVGAASAGFSLLANALAAGRAMLESPDYREIIASARGDAEEMASPAVLKTAKSTANLTSAELSAAELASAVAYAYVRNRDELQFVNAASAAREQEMFATMGAEGGPGAPPGASAGALTDGASGAGARPSPPEGLPQGFGPMTAEDIAKAKAQADILVVEQERINGYEVTPQFFGAWSLEADYGSVFAEGEGEGSSNKLILGSSAAASIAAESGLEGADLVGKKLLARGGYQTIVGILKPTGKAELDDSFFSPYKTITTSGPGGGPRFFGGNVQLRFTVNDPSKLASTEAILSDYFAERYGEAQIAISNPRSEAQRLIDRNAGIGLLILILSLSGLFIALVNVSNILLSRGLRMRRNVGILMAMGASRSRIMGLFSAEALVVAAAGSVLGAALSLPLSGTMQGALGLSAGAWGYALVGAAASCVLTLAFSLVPAAQSSRLVPAEAMRA